MRKRPKLSPGQRVGLFVVPFLLVGWVGLREWFLFVVCGVMWLILVVAYILSPYNELARRFVAPTQKDMDKSEAIADAMRRSPGLGLLVRTGEKLTFGASQRYTKSLRDWQRANRPPDTESSSEDQSDSG